MNSYTHHDGTATIWLLHFYFLSHLVTCQSSPTIQLPPQIIQQLPTAEDEGYHMLPQRDVNLMCDRQVRESVLSLPPIQGQFCFLGCGITRIQTPDDKTNAFVYHCTTQELLLYTVIIFILNLDTLLSNLCWTESRYINYHHKVAVFQHQRHTDFPTVLYITGIYVDEFHNGSTLSLNPFF